MLSFLQTSTGPSRLSSYMSAFCPYAGTSPALAKGLRKSRRRELSSSKRIFPCEMSASPSLMVRLRKDNSRASEFGTAISCSIMVISIAQSPITSTRAQAPTNLHISWAGQSMMCEIHSFSPIVLNGSGRCWSPWQTWPLLLLLVSVHTSPAQEI
jgi:hypothetical protein